MRTNTTVPKPERGEAEGIEADDWTDQAALEVAVRNIMHDLAAGLAAIERAKASAAGLMARLRHQRKSAARQRPSQRSEAATNLWDKF